MKKLLVVLLVACALIWGATGVRAGDSTANQPSSGTSSDETVDAGEITITVTITDQTTGTTTTTTVVITQQQIEESGAQTLAELLRAYPGLLSSGYGVQIGGLAAPSLRGTTTNQTLVMVNGVPINSATNGTPNLNEIMLEDVERVEVMVGPASFVYGANALGGVVNVITRQAKNGLTFKTAMGSYGTGVATMQGSWSGENLGVSVSGTLQNSDGFRENSQADGKSLRLALTLKPTQQFEAVLNAGWQTSEYGLPGPVPAEGVIPQFGSENVTALFDHEHDQVLNSALQLKWTTGTDSFVRLSFQAEQRGLIFETRYADWLTSAQVDETDIYDTTRLASALAWQLPAFRGHHLTIGADGRIDLLNSVMRVLPVAGEPQETAWDARAALAGIWLNDGWTITPAFRLMLGGRLDQSSYGTEFSPAAGLKWDLSEFTSVRASAGRAYRVPTFNDLYWPGSGNPDLKPETGWSAEVRLDTGWSRGTAGACLFGWQTDNMIAWVPGQNGIWEPENVNHARAVGLEGQLAWNLTDCLELSASATWIAGRQVNTEIIYSDWLTGETRTNEVERRLRSVPAISGTAALTWAPPKSGWQTTLTAHYTGDRVNYYPDYSAAPDVTMAEKILPAFLAFDLQIRRQLANWGTLTLGLYNLTDARYDAQFGNTIDDRNFPAAGFHANLSLSVGF